MSEKLIPPTIDNSSASERETFWRQTIAKQKKSRLNMGGFCIAHGLNFSEFKRWRSCFKKENPQVQNNHASKTLHLSHGESSSTPMFLPLTVEDDSASERIVSEPTNIIELRVGEKFSLPLTSNFDENLLRRILTTLEGVS